LEHMGSPIKVLTEIRRILKDNGIVKIAVPNFDSWERKLTNENWFHLDIPRHVYHFSTATMRAILEKNGFTITNIMYAAPEYDFYSFCQSLLNTLPFSEKYLLYKKLQGQAKSSSVLVLNILYQVPFFIVFSLFSLLVVPLCWIFKQSGTIEVTATKNH
ncbi:MAG: methyltransferase domain-containing protein, partial [Patescibacteria group bacterium]